MGERGWLAVCAPFFSAVTSVVLGIGCIVLTTRVSDLQRRVVELEARRSQQDIENELFTRRLDNLAAWNKDLHQELRHLEATTERRHGRTP